MSLAVLLLRLQQDDRPEGHHERLRDGSAIVMPLIGAVFLWGGVAVVTANDIRASKRRPQD